MAEEFNKSSTVHDNVEAKDRGLFDFAKKKDDEKEAGVMSAEFEEKVHVSEPVKEEEKKEESGSLLSKLHRSGSSSSSSSSEEEVEEEGKKIRRKKDKKKKKGEDTSVPVEKCDDVVPEEKKGFMEKIKDKLPGKKSTAEETPVVAVAPAHPPPAAVAATEPEEKKGFLEKIKEKLPGYHAKGSEAEENKEKESH
ncbi:unnamed protein product [Linum tenue]|uniref:Dehydrin n=1 Tax=Linum tenue TaxID=586396 RepID=A0AAV0LLK1_9ROSI|nr:unnamed protein product [Linum tenue]